MNERIERFLEDQHPIVRSGLRTGAGVFALTIAFHVAALIGVRITDSPLLFQFDRFLSLYNTLLYLLLFFMAYHTLKVIYHFVRGQGVFTFLSILLAMLSAGLVGASALNTPDVISAAVAYRAGRSYETVYEEVQRECERWQEEWSAEETITLVPIDEELGQLEAESEVYRVQNTIFFNYAEAGQPEFGLACALHAEAPATSGRAVNYRYQQLDDAQFQFLEEDPRP
jgi:hypothetical protein